MAKNGNQELFNTLRASGVRRKIARTVSKSADLVTEEQSRLFRRTAHGLRAAADLLEVGASRNGTSNNAKSPRKRTSNNAKSARKKASKRPTTVATKSRSGSNARKRSTGPRVAKKAAHSNRRTNNRPRRSSSRAGSRSRA